MRSIVHDPLPLSMISPTHNNVENRKPLPFQAQDLRAVYTNGCPRQQSWPLAWQIETKNLTPGDSSALINRSQFGNLHSQRCVSVCKNTHQSDTVLAKVQNLCLSDLAGSLLTREHLFGHIMPLCERKRALTIFPRICALTTILASTFQPQMETSELTKCG